MAKKKKSKFLLIILIIIVILALGKNFLIKAATEQAVGIATGLPLKIGKLNVALFKTSVHIEDMKLYNPKTFQDRIMVDIPEIYVDYKLLPLFTGKVYLEEMRFHLKEFVVVKQNDGTTNLDALKTLQKPKDQEKAAAKKGKPPKLILDSLLLRVDRVVFKDYSKSPDGKTKEFNIGLNEKHQDIKSLEAVIGVIVFKTLTKTTIASLTNLDLGNLESVISGSAGKIVGQTTDTTKEIIGTTTDTLKDTTDSLKGLIKNPFGKE